MVFAARTDELSAEKEHAIRAMLDLAFEGDFCDEDWEHSLGGTHYWIESGSGEIISHGSVVERELICGGTPVRVAYVEAVATSPGLQGQGFGSELMRRIGEQVQQSFALGALSTGEHGFYARFGWELWHGPTFALDATGNRIRTEEDDGGIMILRTPRTPSALDLRADIVADWRTGDVW